MLSLTVLQCLKNNVKFTVFGELLLDNRKLPVLASRRLFTTVTSRDVSNPKQVKKQDFDTVVNDAAKLVEYTKLDVSFKDIISKKFENIDHLIQKLVMTKHPVVETIRSFKNSTKNDMQMWGLTVLLVSKIAGCASSIPDYDLDNCGILHVQRSLSKIVESMRMAHLIHRTVVNLHPSALIGLDNELIADMRFGNKMTLLCGDYLLTQTFSDLALMRKQKLLEIILTANRDSNESDFVGERNEQNTPMPSTPLSTRSIHICNIDEENYVERDLMVPMDINTCLGIPEKEWALRQMLDGGSLLARGCQGSLHLALQSEEIQEQGYLIGKHLFLAWQAHIDMEPFKYDVLPHEYHGTLNLVSAPVLFHLEHNPSLYTEIEKGKASEKFIDYKKIHHEIIRGPGLEETRKVQKKHISAALKVLQNFPSSEERTALTNIALALYT